MEEEWFGKGVLHFLLYFMEKNSQPLSVELYSTENWKSNTSHQTTHVIFNFS